MELFAVDLDQLAGVVVEHGGPQSHAAILARSLGIPMVGQVRGLRQPAAPGPPAAGGWHQGRGHARPAGRHRSCPPARSSREVETRPSAADAAGLAARRGEHQPAVRGAAGGAAGGGGVGLYRSEFLFLARRTLPTEDEQVTIYRKLLTLMEGRPVCIRTFDLRPDKLASYSHLGPAATRPYDWRLVLESPPLQQLFREQVRAILRAATAGPVRMLVPLVTRTEVLDFVTADGGAGARTTWRAGAGVRRPSVPLGVMIEVAAAVPLVGGVGRRRSTSSRWARTT